MTSCPRSRSSATASPSASWTRGSTGMPSIGESVVSAIRRRARLLGGLRRERGRGTASPRRRRRARGRRARRAPRRCRASSARRRRRRRGTSSRGSGAALIRPRWTLSPTRFVQAAGMRVEPPPSLAWAIGIMPAATAAAAPPDEPPVVRVGIPRVARGAEPARLGRRHDAELGEVRRADDDRPGLAQARDADPVERGDEVAEERGGEREPLALDGAVVLDRDRDAGERAASSPGFTASAASSASSWKTSMKAL